MWIRFLSDDLAYVHMQWGWMDPRLVLISVIVALATAMLAVHVCTRAQRTAPGPRRTGMAAAGVLLLGGGIWSMHFIGMQAFTPCAAGTFSILHSALSALPSLLAAAVVVHTLLQQSPPWWRVLASGVYWPVVWRWAWGWLPCTSGACLRPMLHI